jgi:hypothetical protein
MSEWRQQIVRRFVPGVARVTAVSDADGLLRDPGVFQAIEAKGFSIVQFEDSISFRFDYESRFRSKWDAGSAEELVVVFKPEQRDFETLPADVLANADRLSFTLKDIFPKLSYTVVSQLETVYFDALFQAQQQHATQPHDEAQTRGFVLRQVFGIEPTVIRSVPDLLRMLCQRHYNKTIIPGMLEAHLIAALRANSNFAGWPLEIIVPNRAAFWEFLNERWPIFVRQSKGGTMILREERSSLKYPGPELLPFGHDDVRVYIDNLFEDGLLTPVDWDWGQAIEKTWIRVGLLGNQAENTDLRFEELGKHLLKECPDKAAMPQDWLTYAFRYAQANVLWTQITPAARAHYQKQFPELRGHVNQQFFDWLSNHYAGLYNYPATSPLMVHHIPGFINHELVNNPSRRIAFILVDGLAIDQWLVLKESLKAGGLAGAGTIEEDALFAWIPTVTPISRQATFAGKIPRYLADTILRTDRDEARWRQFWADRGLLPQQIGFVSISGDTTDLPAVDESLTPQTRVLGITLYKVDKIMHGMQLGTVGMCGQVRTWAEEGFPLGLLIRLRDKGFDVFISADHGNTEAVGIGRPQEGVLSDKRGERCRIYSDVALRKGCLAEFVGTQAWDHPGLPENISTLLAPYGKAYTEDGTILICHGGAALEEVCVPFIRIPAHA